MKKSSQIQLLEKMKKVDPPPFLYTRIEAQIDNLQRNQTPLKWIVLSTTAFCLLLIINCSVLSTYFTFFKNTETIHHIAEEMQLMNYNQFYYD